MVGKQKKCNKRANVRLTHLLKSFFTSNRATCLLLMQRWLCCAVALCQQRSENVEQYNDGGGKDQFTESGCSDHHRERKQHEGIANAVAFPTVALEFERKHGDFTDHNLTRPDDEQEHADPKNREINLNGRFAKPYCERTPKEGVGRCGKADEGMTLARVEVEFCQPQRRKSGNQKSGVRENHTQGARAVGTAPGVLAEQREDHRCRSYSEGDNIGERIEFLADGTGHTQ